MCFPINPFNIRITAFNCHGNKTSTDTIQQVLCNQFDVILLQETWLYPDELTLVSNLCKDFTSFSLSSMSTHKQLIKGRPHGGISIMWRKSIPDKFRIIQYDVNRILGLELQTNDFTLLFLCIYLPYDCDANYDHYCFYLNKLQCIIESSNTPYIFALGNYNANVQSESVFGSELIKFCVLNNLCFVDKSSLLPDSYTFVSQPIILHPG